MNHRYFWLPAIATLGLCAAGGITPVSARGGGHGIGISSYPRTLSVPAPRVSAHDGAVTPRVFVGRSDLRSRRGNQIENGWPVGLWPYGSTWYPAPLETSAGGDDMPANPQVIVVSGLITNAPERTAPQAPADYSYVPGCHAIPNGYHCDVARKDTATP